MQEFERALMLDPEFALARAALASAYTQLHFYDATDRRFDQKAFVEIERALRIDPRLPEAYLARAQLTWTARNRFPHEAAITDLRRAVALNPNLADAHLELEKIYYHIGLTDKAIAAGEQVQTARSLSGVVHQSNLSGAHRCRPTGTGPTRRGPQREPGPLCSR